MRTKAQFEYAVIRFVPRVEREEFVNVGVILFSKTEKYIGMRYLVDENRIRALCPDADIELLQTALAGFQETTYGTNVNTPIGKWDMIDRFRWLTANRSSILQTSPVHPGICPSGDLELTLNKLFLKLVSN